MKIFESPERISIHQLVNIRSRCIENIHTEKIVCIDSRQRGNVFIYHVGLYRGAQIGEGWYWNAENIGDLSGDAVRQVDLAISFRIDESFF